MPACEVGRDVGEHGRLDEEAAITDVRRASATARDGRALLLRALDRGQDHVVLRPADHRADLRVEVGRVTDSQRRRTVDEAVDERVVDVVVDEEARARFAHLALMEEGAEERAVDGDVEVRVGADDVRRLAAELERHLLDGRGRGGEDLAAGRGRPGERDLVHVGVLDQLDPGVDAVTGDHVEHAAWAAARSRRSRVPPRARSAVSARAGLSTIELPIASAGAIFHIAKMSG